MRGWVDFGLFFALTSSDIKFVRTTLGVLALRVTTRFTAFIRRRIRVTKISRNTSVDTSVRFLPILFRYFFPPVSFKIDRTPIRGYIRGDLSAFCRQAGLNNKIIN